jgi:hypothetical protein
MDTADAMLLPADYNGGAYASSFALITKSLSSLYYECDPEYEYCYDSKCVPHGQFTTCIHSFCASMHCPLRTLGHPTPAAPCDQPLIPCAQCHCHCLNAISRAPALSGPCYRELI